MARPKTTVAQIKRLTDARIATLQRDVQALHARADTLSETNAKLGREKLELHNELDVRHTIIADMEKKLHVAEGERDKAIAHVHRANAKIGHMGAALDSVLQAARL